jgi:hypothetical protein
MIKEFFNKVGLTFNMLIMSPMLGDDPKSTSESRKKIFWNTLKQVWSGKLNEF